MMRDFKEQWGALNKRPVLKGLALLQDSDEKIEHLAKLLNCKPKEVRDKASFLFSEVKAKKERIKELKAEIQRCKIPYNQINNTDPFRY